MDKVQGKKESEMIVVVDSNIVFSAILNSQSKIGQLIINSSRFFHLYSVSLLKDEIELHKDKLLAISGFTDQQYQNSYQTILSRIKFVDDILIPDNVIEDAIHLVSDVDENDVLFVALANHLNAKLWTGDKKLMAGLRVKGYSDFLTTNDLYQIFLDKQYRSTQRRR